MRKLQVQSFKTTQTNEDGTTYITISVFQQKTDYAGTKDGYYLLVVPETIKQRDGYSITTQTAYSGIKKHIGDCKRFSQKKLNDLRRTYSNPVMYVDLLEHVLEKNKLTLSPYSICGYCGSIHYDNDGDVCRTCENAQDILITTNDIKDNKIWVAQTFTASDRGVNWIEAILNLQK